MCFYFPSFIRCLFLVMALAGLWAQPAAAVEYQDVTFVLADDSEVRSMDPQRSGSNIGAVMTYIFQGLVGPSITTQAMLPNLCESWEVVSPTAWKFTLRKGVTFHNGDPFTSQDVQYSFYRQMGRVNKGFPGSNSRTWDEMIKEVEIVDDHTVIIHTSVPDSSILGMIRFMWMVPKNYIEKVGDEQFGKKAVGTGPYMVKSYQIGEGMQLEAYDNFWNTGQAPDVRGKSRIKNVRIRAIPQEQTRLAAIQAGEIDGCEVSIDSAKAIEGRDDMTVYYNHKNQPIFVMFNWGPGPKNWKPGRPGYNPNAPNPFKDVRVRQALNHAVDVEALYKAYGTGQEYRTTLVGKGGIGYNPDVPFYDYNPEKARKLLAEAGYPNGFTTKFYTAADAPAYLEALFSYFRSVGVNIERVQTTPPVVRRNMYMKRLDGMLVWGAGYGGPDPAANWLKTCVSSAGNWALHPEDPEIEKWIEESFAEFDQEKRGQIIDRIVQKIWRQAWFVPLFEPVYANVVRNEWEYTQAPVIRTIYLPSLYKKK